MFIENGGFTRGEGTRNVNSLWERKKLNMKPERLQKLASNYSKYARRQFEQFIKEERVTVNGQLAELGTKATINDDIKLDGHNIKFTTKQDYYILYKPKGYICERQDKYGRTAISLIPQSEHRNLFTVGRLDVNTTGLVIVTNDGSLTDLVLRPDRKKKKVYLASLKTPIGREELEMIRRGVILDDGYKSRPVRQIKFIDEKQEAMVKLTLTEGKKNQVKRMFKAVGSEVKNLKRIEIEGLNLNGMRIGDYRKLSKQELYGALGILSRD